MEEIWKWLAQNGVALLALILTPFLAWFFNRRTQTANVKKIDAEGTLLLVDSSGKLVTSWQTLYNELKKENEESAKRNEELIKQNDKLIEQNNKLIEQNREAKIQNELSINQMNDFKDRLQKYTNGMEKIFGLMLAEIQSTNPDLAKSVRENFSEISQIFSK